MEALSIAALVVAATSLATSFAVLRAARRGTGPAQAAEAAKPPKAPARADVAKLRDEVAALRSDLADALRHLAVVRYDAFGDEGGHLSWSIALLDDNGNGAVLTSINSRTATRSYAKNIREYAGDSKLSPEEQEAIDYLRKEADTKAPVRREPPARPGP